MNKKEFLGYGQWATFWLLLVCVALEWLTAKDIWWAVLTGGAWCYAFISKLKAEEIKMMPRYRKKRKRA